MIINNHPVFAAMIVSGGMVRHRLVKKGQKGEYTKEKGPILKAKKGKDSNGITQSLKNYELIFFRFRSNSKFLASNPNYNNPKSGSLNGREIVTNHIDFY